MYFNFTEKVSNIDTKNRFRYNNNYNNPNIIYYDYMVYSETLKKAKNSDFYYKMITTDKITINNETNKIINYLLIKNYNQEGLNFYLENNCDTLFQG